MPIIATLNHSKSSENWILEEDGMRICGNHGDHHASCYKWEPFSPWRRGSWWGKRAYSSGKSKISRTVAVPFFSQHFPSPKQGVTLNRNIYDYWPFVAHIFTASMTDFGLPSTKRSQINQFCFLKISTSLMLPSRLALQLMTHSNRNIWINNVTIFCFCFCQH